MSTELNEIIPFKEIRECPIHYCQVLAEEPEDSFVLFQYGPYLVSQYPEYFLKRINFFKNSSLIFMVHIYGFLYSMRNSSQTIKQMKEELGIYITHARGTFVDRIVMIGNVFRKELSRKEQETHSLESAILDYTPIVQYARGFLVKPEMAKSSEKIFTEKRCPTILEVESRIYKQLNDFIIPILENPYAFIQPEDPNPTLMHIITTKDNIDKNVGYYFLLVYLRYCVKNEDYYKTLENLFVLNNNINKFITGKRGSVTEALSALESIHPVSIPD